MKYPIGIQDFKTIIEDGYVYVDKTALIYRLVTEGKVYFLSRPRRFGKSLLVSTLEYYFKGEKELFKGLAIDSLEKDWNSYPIFHIDFNSTVFTQGGALQKRIKGLVEGWEKEYGFQGNPDYDYGQRFEQLLAYVHEQTGKRCVVLIDEYDKPLLDVLDLDYKMDVGGQLRPIEECNRDTLKVFYSVFKTADPHLKFVLLTGVTKFSQVSVFSGFNQPQDISMDARYDALCGITKEEMESVFGQETDKMAETLHVSPMEMREKLTRQYDGYHFSEGMTDIFNPFSVLNAFSKRSLRDYWFSTGTPTYLIRLLSHCNENLHEMTGKYYEPRQFVDYRATIERPLPMIYQSGYLTIKDYDPDTRSYLLDFPNNEVKNGFLSIVASDYLKVPEDNIPIIEIARALRRNDLESLRLQLTSFFASIPYTMRRKENEREKERYFHYTFYLLFRIISTYLVLAEKQQSGGRADCIIEAQNDIYIFEFKLDGTAQEALDQIEDKGYARPYLSDKRTIHKIGVSFSSETGTIDDWQDVNTDLTDLTDLTDMTEKF